MHFFFEMGDGSYLAFFDTGGNDKPAPSPNTPDWVQHFAIETDSVADVSAMRDRLREHGVETTDVVDHEFLKSIYFFDPNGLRLEVTTRTEPEGFLETEAQRARAILDTWTARKRKAIAPA